MRRYVCVHGHFYQPPRENPWLEVIEQQDSAAPYHDWNQRITAECYAPNASARILDRDGWIQAIVNNYARMSFNFGPTLLAWMQRESPETYAAIRQADAMSRARFGGHGAAIAQVYNHMIMPLADAADKRTQVMWGMADFERRFGRVAEGMWLAETAVDRASLEALAEHGVRFTILAPRQALRARPQGGAWSDVSGGRIDPRRAYRVGLPSGREMAVFFYDGPTSQGIAFEGLLNDGAGFVDRLIGGFARGGARDAGEESEALLVNVATDGETYGHHHRYGDMALAYALERIESQGLATVTSYAAFLAAHPPRWEVEIADGSSWSCVHGVERWRADCGCSTGARPGYRQAWRGPLRAAFDWLRDELRSIYAAAGGELLRDPWAARDGYIAVVLDRSPANVDRFLAQHARRALGTAERVRALQLLEAQRHAMLMYTSCGWFFDDLAGIEAVQCIQYAGRALQLGGEIAGRSLEEPFLARLERAQSNLAEPGNGRQIYLRQVRPRVVDLGAVAAHYGVRMALGEVEQNSVYAYEVERIDGQRHEVGRARLATGRVRIRSSLTGESADLTFAALHLGDHNLTAGVREYTGDLAYQAMLDDLDRRFRAGDLGEAVRCLDRHFGTSSYSLRSLFRDDQRQIVERLLQSALDGTEAIYRQVFDLNASLWHFLTDIGMPLPKAFGTAAEFVLSTNLERAAGEEPLPVEKIAGYLRQAKDLGVELRTPELSLALRRAMERAMDRLAATPADTALLGTIEAGVALIQGLDFEVHMWKVINVYHRLVREEYPRLRHCPDDGAAERAERYRALGERLKIRLV